MPFAAGIWLAGSLREFYTLALTSDAPYNETHWFHKDFDKSVAAAIAATSKEQATELWLAPQKVQYEQGGYIMWASQSNVDAASAKVHGITPSRVNFLGMPTGLMNAWIA
jgi:peptide/nickel transport system substrate-binding protein